MITTIADAISSIALAVALVSIAITRRAAVLNRSAQRKLDAIAALEVHGGEFVDAAALYKIPGKPIPDPIDHAANLRARHPLSPKSPKGTLTPPVLTTQQETPPSPYPAPGQPPYRSPYT